MFKYRTSLELFAYRKHWLMKIAGASKFQVKFSAGEKQLLQSTVGIIRSNNLPTLCLFTDELVKVNIGR